MRIAALRNSLAIWRQRPGVATIAVLTLALGIGANTAVFSVIDAVLLRPLPYPEPDSLVVPIMLNRGTGSRWGSVAYPDYLEWRQQVDVFEQVGVLVDRGYDLTGNGEPEKVRGVLVSEDYFPLSRTLPVLGRGLVKEDFEAGRGKVVVLSEGLWRRRFGGRRDLLGDTVRLNDVAYTVVGVVDPKKVFPSDPDLWLPLVLGLPEPGDEDNYFLRPLIRLKRGVELETAEARVVALADRLAREMPSTRGDIGIQLMTLKDDLVGGESRVVLGLVFATVLMVLAIACFNVANLLFVRAVERKREIAVRLALGAGLKHLVRLLLSESMVLAFTSGALGLLLAGWGLEILRSRAPADMPGLMQLAVNRSVLGFTFGLSCLTALAFGLLPAWQLTSKRLSDCLREAGAASAAGGRSGQRMRSGLVVAELALSLILLATAGLLVRSLEQVSQRDTGVDVEQRLSFTVDPPRERYPEKILRDGLFVELLERLEALPQVKRVSASSSLPLGAGGETVSRVHLLEHRPEPPQGPEYRAKWNVVTADYFRTLGISLFGGRTFAATDTAESNPVIIVNQAFAEQMFAGQDPIGLRIRSWRDENRLREIVGVVGPVRYDGIAEEWTPMVYVPYTQVGWPRLNKVVLHATGDPIRLAAAIRAEVWGLDDKLPVTQISTLEEIAADSVIRQRYLAWLLGACSALALVLAALGLYGVISYSISQRTREIGIRMALGADAGDVLRSVVRQGLVLALAGSAIGMLVVLVLNRWLSSLLAEISPADPFTYLGVLVVLLGVTSLASLGPAWRAATVEPLRALRHE